MAKKAKDEKRRERFFVGEKEVKPVRVGGTMWWTDGDGVYYKKWLTKK